MSINLQRAPRTTDFHKPKTPASLGPGTYNPRRNSTDNREK